MASPLGRLDDRLTTNWCEGDDEPFLLLFHGVEPENKQEKRENGGDPSPSFRIMFRAVCEKE